MSAFVAVASHRDCKFRHGAAMLTVLARSDAASNEEKAVLDSVWERAAPRCETPRYVGSSRNSAQSPSSVTTPGRSVNHVSGKNQVLSTLEVLRARLKVVLGMELGRQTSPLFASLWIYRLAAYVIRAGYPPIRIREIDGEW